MSKKCGECEDYYCCKADRRTRYDKYLPKNKKACEHFTPKKDEPTGERAANARRIEGCLY